MNRSPKSVLRERDDFGRIYGNRDINEKRHRLANRATRPINSREPQTISTTPTNGAMTPGEGLPIFTKRPTPRESGNKNFCIPSERKTQPTRIRMSKIAFAARSAQVAFALTVIALSLRSREVRNEVNRVQT
jgi:hypothetical protein